MNRLLLPAILLFALLGCTSDYVHLEQTKILSPTDHLPPHITRLTHFGQRADWSHDGKQILFVEKTFGDVYEIDLKTKTLRPMTHHYFHEGYTRALYLSNGDILLSGARKFNPEDPWPSREVTAELWVLKKDLSGPPLPLGQYCFEGPAVSRKNMKIAWTIHHDNYPDRVPEGVWQMWMGNIIYENSRPKLTDQRMILDNRALSFECELETQNFRPPDEKELIFSIYIDSVAEVMGLQIETGKVVNYTNTPPGYDEPEGIFPNGKFALVESDRHNLKGPAFIDIYKLILDGSGRMERLTYFVNYPGYQATNPAVSDDGRFMAFQTAKKDDAAGVGRGIFIFDLPLYKKNKQK